MLAFKSIYWINRNTNIQKAIKYCPTYLDYQPTWPNNKVMSHEHQGGHGESVRSDIFTINSKHYICNVDYCSKFPVVKQVKGFSADNLIKNARLSFQNTSCSVKIVSDAAQTLFEISSQTSTKDSVYDMQLSSTYNHHSKWQAEAWF